MIDIRYHIASLVAIFFALGLGILMGAQLANEGALTEEHNRLIEQIEARVEQVRADNRKLTEQLAETDALLALEQSYADDMLHQLAAQRLDGVHVNVFVADGTEAYRERVLRGLSRAGAQIAVTDAAASEEVWRADIGERGVVLVLSQDEDANSLLSRGAVWASPRSGAEKGDPALADDVQLISAVDTPPGLLRLIDVLRQQADLFSFDAVGEGQ